MIVKMIELTREADGPPVHLSMGNWRDGHFWVQIGIGGNKIIMTDMVEREWLSLLAQLPAVTAGKKRAAVMAGELAEE